MIPRDLARNSRKIPLRLFFFSVPLPFFTWSLPIFLSHLRNPWYSPPCSITARLLFSSFCFVQLRPLQLDGVFPTKTSLLWPEYSVATYVLSLSFSSIFKSQNHWLSDCPFVLLTSTPLLATSRLKPRTPPALQVRPAFSLAMR